MKQKCSAGIAGGDPAECPCVSSKVTATARMMSFYVCNYDGNKKAQNRASYPSKILSV